MNLEPDLLFGLISALVSMVAAGTSFHFSRKSQATQAMVSEVELANWKQQYLNELRSWADLVCDVLSDAIHQHDRYHEAADSCDMIDRRCDIRARLSSLIDRGRWFFPNQEPEQAEQHKPVGFRGARDPILSQLVEAYDLLSLNLDQEQVVGMKIRDQLVTAKREFVAKIHVSYDPWTQNADLQRYVERMAELRGEPKPAPQTDA